MGHRKISFKADELQALSHIRLVLDHIARLYNEDFFLSAVEMRRLSQTHHSSTFRVNGLISDIIWKQSRFSFDEVETYDVRANERFITNAVYMRNGRIDIARPVIINEVYLETELYRIQENGPLTGCWCIRQINIPDLHE